MQAGRVGDLALPMTLADFAGHVDKSLATRTWTWGSREQFVKRVAVVGGAADGEWIAAQQAGADVFLTGEVKQNVAVDVGAADFAIVAAGHFATENPGMERMAERLSTALPQIKWEVFVPAEGSSGRPW
jgi:putative NIF3 family GTP cyclohydrolase 1 type 2